MAFATHPATLPRSRRTGSDDPAAGDANILGIFICNLEGAIIGASEAFLQIAQYGREDVILGRVRWTDLTPEEWRERDECALAELKATATVQPYEKEFFRKDGSRVPVLVGAAPFEGARNEGVASYSI